MIRDWSTIKGRLRDDLDTFVYVKTQRKPMVITIIVEV